LSFHLQFSSLPLLFSPTFISPFRSQIYSKLSTFRYHTNIQNPVHLLANGKGENF
jgi:hypothetical protein